MEGVAQSLMCDGGCRRVLVSDGELSVHLILMAKYRQTHKVLALAKLDRTTSPSSGFIFCATRTCRVV